MHAPGSFELRRRVSGPIDNTRHAWANRKEARVERQRTRIAVKVERAAGDGLVEPGFDDVSSCVGNRIRVDAGLWDLSRLSGR